MKYLIACLMLSGAVSAALAEDEIRGPGVVSPAEETTTVDPDVLSSTETLTTDDPTSTGAVGDPANPFDDDLGDDDESRSGGAFGGSGRIGSGASDPQDQSGTTGTGRIGSGVGDQTDELEQGQSAQPDDGSTIGGAATE
jgi:hypothetical protein